MKLSQIDIKNYRSIADLSLPIDFNCQVLIGINESGKSNILRALSLLDPSNNPTQADLRIPRHQEPDVTDGYVRFRFSLSNEESLKIASGMESGVCQTSLDRPILKLAGKEMNIRDWCLSTKEALYRINFPSAERYFSTWSLPQDCEILNGWLRNKAEQEITLTHNDGHQLKIPPGGLWQAVNGFQYTDDQFRKATKEDITKLFSRQFKTYLSDKLPKCIFWRYADNYLLPSSIDVSSFCENPESCIPLKSILELADLNSDGLKEKFTTAQSSHQNRYIQLLERISHAATKHIRSVWKDYKNVQIKLQANGSSINPTVVDEQVHLDMANRSDGFKRFVSFLLLISAKVKTTELKNCLILVDEPEIALHPSGAKSLMKELISIGNSNTVIYSTHSIFMIDKDEIGRHLVVKKENEQTTTWRADKSNVQDEEVLYSAIGYSIFESLKPFNVIFEGWRDKEIFKILANSIPKSDKTRTDKLKQIGQTFAEGVKDIRNIARILELANRHCLIISDADSAGLQGKRQYEAPNAWGAWKTLKDAFPSSNIQTSEDLINRATIVKKSNRFRSTAPNLAELSEEFFRPTESTIAGLRRWVESAEPAENIDLLMNQLKSMLFDGLKRSDLVDEAETLLDFVLEHYFQK